MNEELRMKIETLECEKRTLLNKLSASSSDIGDWKVVKCYEAKMLDKEMPYNFEQLVSDRQAVRDRINKIEEELAELSKNE